VMMDEMKIRLTDMLIMVCPGDGSRGDNIIRDLGPGLRVTLHRPLAVRQAAGTAAAADVSGGGGSGTTPPLPPLHAAVSVPQLAAVISEVEYRRLLAVLSGNFSETVPSDPRVAELHQRLLRHATAAASSPPPPAAAAAAAAPPQAADVPNPAATPQPTPQHPHQQPHHHHPHHPRPPPLLDFTLCLRSVLA
ncbi:hypothetical protein Agub_g14844, partial [Astrephomene gubernaculifera]